MVNDNKVLICWYDIWKVVCSALVVPVEAIKDNSPFQFGGMTLNIWIEKNLRELLMASQTGRFKFFLSFRRYSQPLWTPAKNVSRCHRPHPQWQKHQRSHLFPWFGLVVLRWTVTKSSSAYMTYIRSCMLCPAGASGMRSDQWQNKQRSHLVSRFGLVFLWWTMTKSSSV